MSQELKINELKTKDLKEIYSKVNKAYIEHHNYLVNCMVERIKELIGDDSNKRSTKESQ